LRADVEILVGCDFGAPLPAGAQSKKTIAIEALRSGERAYQITATGRNERLVRTFDGSRHWSHNRRGWTIADLALSIATDLNVVVLALDFPFSIPTGLLCDETFAARVAANVFGTRQNWISFVASRIDLSFESDSAAAKLRVDSALRGWRDKAFWTKRTTDIATNGQPPLKDKFQNLFNMTIIGSRFLGLLSSRGMQITLRPDEATGVAHRSVIETYPGAIAAAIGFKGNYKKDPELCLHAAEDYLHARGIKLEFDQGVRRFCLDYRTPKDDPDGADAFLCLLTAICFREGFVQWCHGDASRQQLGEEGCIVAPANLAR
jgi:hypothetical protein